MTESVILVDRRDRKVGVAEKMKAHRVGMLHRAFSAFVFNRRGEMLLQRRALHKYHSGGLWTNACCSHPRPGESVAEASSRRLFEEMGFRCPLEKAFHFIYRVRLDNDLIEHEFDHVLVGEYDREVTPDPREVMDYRWLSLEAVRREIREDPESYTAWFRIALPRALQYQAERELA